MNKNLICSLVVVLSLFHALSVKAENSEPKCRLQDPTSVAPGYTCYTEEVNSDNIFWWRLEAKTKSGKKVWKDMTTGLLISGLVVANSQYEARDICTDTSSLDARGNLTAVKWKLPTGYPKDLNGKQGFPDFNSDFVTLEAHGFREALYLGSGTYCSSSIDPNDTSCAYSFITGGFSDRESPWLIPHHNRKDPTFVLCIGRVPETEEVK